MFNGAYAQVRRSCDRARRMTMSRDIFSPPSGLLYRCDNFPVRKLIHPNGIRRQKDAPRQHDLDAMSPATKFLSSRRSDRILAIHDKCHTAVRRASARADPAERVTEITVSARHGKCAPREVPSRSPDQSLRDGSRDPGITAPDIAYGGETAVEGVA